MALAISVSEWNRMLRLKTGGGLSSAVLKPDIMLN